MTNEKMLEHVAYMLQAYNSADDLMAIYHRLQDVKGELLGDIREKANTASGRHRESAAIKRLLKRLPDARRKMNGWMPVGTQYGFTDTVMAAIVNHDYGYEKAVECFDLASCRPNLNSLDENEVDIDIGRVQTLVEDGKARRKAQKAYNGCIVGDKRTLCHLGEACFDADRLLDLMLIINPNRVYAGTAKQPCVCINDETGEHGFLLPIRENK